MAMLSYEIGVNKNGEKPQIFNQ